MSNKIRKVGLCKGDILKGKNTKIIECIKTLDVFEMDF